MRRPGTTLRRAAVLVACAGAAVPARGGSGTRLEIGAYAEDVTGADDRLGERVLLGLPVKGRFTSQIEALHEDRDGDGESVVTGSLWYDVSPHFFVFGDGAVGDGGFFPEERADVELHAKVRHHEKLVLFAGLGGVRFDADDVAIYSIGATRYFAQAVLSYKYLIFDNHARSPGGKGGGGGSHVLETTFGHEDGPAGLFDLQLVYGDDFLHDFSAPGRDDHFRTRFASLAWRRWWGTHFGTHLQAQWGDKDAILERRGVDLRLLWRSAPSPGSERARDPGAPRRQARREATPPGGPASTAAAARSKVRGWR